MMHSAIHEIESLLAASRRLLDSKDLTVETLLDWGMERATAFKRIQYMDIAMLDDDSSRFAQSALELSEMDTQVRARVIELQKRISRQIAAARKTRQVLRQGVANTPLLLQRSI